MLDAIERGEYDEAQLREMFGDMLQPLVDKTRASSARGTRQPHQAMGWPSSHANTLLRRIYRGARSDVGHSRADVGQRLDPRLTKEAGQWMYDRLSLRLLLEQAGFQDVRQRDHLSSSIPGWSRYDFDRSNNGDYPLDPSIYMEGMKPGRPRRDP